MSPAYPMGVAIPPADRICQNVKTNMSPPAVSLLQPEMTAGEYLDALINDQLDLDALIFAAYAMPIRYAIWWGYLGLLTLQEAFSEDEKIALDACLAWVSSPGDMERNIADRLASQLEADSPARMLAQSVAYVSVRLPQPKYGKPQNFPAKGVYSALWTGSALTDDASQALREFLKLGLRVSLGEIPLPKP